MTRSIYVIASEPGPVKVGIAGKVRERLAQLRTSSPYPLSVAYAAETDADVAAVERRAHEILAAQRLTGEWFNAPSAEAVAAVLRAAEELGADLSELSLAPLVREPDELKSIRFNMVISPSEVAAVDAWRKKQDDLPSRSEAIRRLVAQALAAGPVAAG